MIQSRAIFRSWGQLVVALGVESVLLWVAGIIMHSLSLGIVGSFLKTYWLWVSLALLIIQVVVFVSREFKYRDSISEETDHVSVVYALHDDDPDRLALSLRSVVFQSRQPQAIYVVDSGSCIENYDAVRDWFIPFAHRHGVAVYWSKQDYEGIRQAHVYAFEQAVFASVFVTVSASAVLDTHALAELLKPLTDESVQAVSGMALICKNQSAINARMMDVMYVTEQLAESAYTEPVASEGLAAYRASTIRDNIELYLSDARFDYDVELCDDSMLMLYALRNGQTVNQPTALFFTKIPDRMNYQLAAQARWAKSWIIRIWWRQKYLPSKLASMKYVTRRLAYAIIPTLLPFILLLNHRIDIALEIILYGLLVLSIFAYTVTARYFSIRRADQSSLSRMFTYILSPVAFFWFILVVRPIKFYSVLSVLLYPGRVEKLSVMSLDASSVGRHTLQGHLQEN